MTDPRDSFRDVCVWCGGFGFPFCSPSHKEAWNEACQPLEPIIAAQRSKPKHEKVERVRVVDGGEEGGIIVYFFGNERYGCVSVDCDGDVIFSTRDYKKENSHQAWFARKLPAIRTGLKTVKEFANGRNP